MVAPALTPASASKETVNTTTRLHITPFNPALLKTYIPPSVLPQATNISYHSVETFPEKGFGYVDVPTMEAQKLKKKFNGSILKGAKVRIEDAKPEKRKRVLEEQIDSVADEKSDTPKKRLKKPKRTEKLVTGFELPDERKVRRGWTEPEAPAKSHKDAKSKDKKEKKRKAEPSKYTKEPELLFRATLPPTAATTASLKSGKSKKSKAERDIVVHEFEKTAKHASFLKGNQIPKDAKHAVEYVDGKGWTDKDGNVVEPEPEQREKRRKAHKALAEEARKAEAATSKALAEEAKLQAARSKPKAAKESSPPASAGEHEDDSDDSSVVSTSSSDVSSSSSDEASEVAASDAESEPVAKDDTVEEAVAGASSEESEDEDLSADASSDGASELTNEASDDQPDDAPKEVHPLEALFKRPKAPETGSPSAKLAPINTSFSFFDADAGADDDELGDLPAQTPHTFEDRQFRGIRSAAPTPDTAAIGKKFLTPWRDEDEEDVDGDSNMPDANAAQPGTGPIAQKEELPQSDFAKHFWEKQGDYNRAWKKRRRDSMKQKRHRENKRIGRRVV